MTGALAFIGGLGVSELLVILGVATIVFGAGRIPEIAKSLGKGIREFKKAGREVMDDVESVTDDEHKDEGK